jgi:hypothetical protein
MELVAKSTLQAYARQFWRRESDKRNQEGTDNFVAVERGEDPVSLLRKAHPYKLPNPHNAHVSIVAFTSRDEVENLLIHEYMPNDKWMEARNLRPKPFTRQLGTLASISLERRYFESGRDDRQIKNFRDWKARGSLRNVIGMEDRPLVESTGAAEFEIVDGWGRLLPFAALLLQGLPFESVQLFCASTNSDPTK